MASEYADTKYYNPPSSQEVPDGPLALAHVTRGDDGKLKTVYLDINTGEELKDLKGYTVLDSNGNYYKPTEASDTNKDGTIDDDEATNFVGSKGGAVKQGIGSGKSVEAGGGPKGDATNNFGYTSKPSLMGPIGMAASVVNPGIGAAVGMASKAINMGNMSAVNEARKGLGLPGLTGPQQAKGFFKDNQGQIANVNIGDNKYSVGFEAMSPDNKTNLTYSEAKTRAAILGQKITETPKDQVTPAPEKQEKSLISKITGLDKGFARKALGIDKKEKTPEKPAEISTTKESPATKLTGLERGWLSKALNDLTTANKVSPEVAAKLPDVVASVPTPRPDVEAQTPTVAPTPSPAFADTPDTVSAPSNRPTAVSTPNADKTDTGYSSAASAGLSQAVGPSQANPLGIGAGSVGFVGRVNNPSIAEHPSLAGIIDGSKPDRIGRVGLMSVDPDKLGLQPAMAAQVKSFQQKAVEAGIADKLSIDVTNAVRTPEQQKAIMDAGFSKTKLGYHNIGLAVDISPTAINDKNQITDQATLDKSRQIAKDLGLGTLNPSFDPAHIQPDVPGMTARQVARQAIDPTTGLPGLSPEQDLGVRMNSVPTPTARPDPTDVTSSISQSKTYDSQVGLAQATNPDTFSGLKSSMDSYSGTASVSSKLANTPAGLAAMGFTNRTAAEKAAISRTVAGELGQKSLAALRGDDPDARARALAEVGNIVATVENRAATTKYAGITKTLAPSQYNANMASNAKVTNQNYQNNPAVSAAVNSFYDGGIAGTNYGATNYHATNMANPPSWSGQMAGVAAVGQHMFGSLPGYSPSPENQARMDAFGTMAGTQFSPGKAKDDADMGSTTSATTGLGVSDHKSTPGYGGAGLGYGGADTGAAARSLGNPGGSSGAQGASGSQGSSASGSSGSGSSSSGNGSSAGGLGASKSGDKSPAGGYATGATKGSTGGL